MRSPPSSHGGRALALRALALTLCVPLGAVAILAAGVFAALRYDLVLLGWAGLFVALPGLQTLQWTRRAEREGPPGATVERAAEPVLWRLVEEECAALELAAPTELRISLDHEIWVERHAGGRTLVVGAPLAFAVSERVLRVAVTHALLRDANRMGRMLDGWARRVLDRAHSWAILPLSWPWRALTERIWPHVAAALRARVLVADADCARRLGAGAAAGFLRAKARDDIFATYWQDEVAPCLEAGYRPPLLEGWTRFRQDPAVSEHVNTAIATGLDVAGVRQDPAPTHGERLAAIEAVAGAAGASAGSGPLVPRTPPAALEAAALRASGGSGGGVLVEVGWDRVAQAVWRPRLVTAAALHRHALEGQTLADLPRLAAQAARRPDAARGGLTLDALAAVLAVALADRGWQLVAQPPGPLRAVHDDHELLVLQIPRFLAGGREHEEWERLMAETGLTGVPLAPAVDDAPTAPSPLEPQWPTLTVPSALELRRTPQVRRMTAAALAIAGPLGVVLCVVLGGLAVSASRPFESLGFGVAAGMASLALLWWLAKRARIAFGRGSLSITSGGLRIEDSGLLREPLVIDRSLIRAVAIDAGAARNVLGLPLRFPFGPSPWGHPSSPALAASGWLWTGAHDSSVPVLGAGDEVPNVLLLFSEPVPGPPMRLRGRGLPHGREALAALALRVEDLAAAHQAFAGWDVVRPLSEEDGRLDLGPVFAFNRDRAAQRRAWRRGWLLVACGLVIPPVALIALWDAATLRRSARLRSAALTVAAVVVVTVRGALYAGWIWRSAAQARNEPPGVARMRAGDRAAAQQLGDLLLVVAGLAQDGLGVLAELGSRQPAGVGGRARDPDRRAELAHRLAGARLVELDDHPARGRRARTPGPRRDRARAPGSTRPRRRSAPTRRACARRRSRRSRRGLAAGRRELRVDEVLAPDAATEGRPEARLERRERDPRRRRRRTAGSRRARRRARHGRAAARRRPRDARRGQREPRQRAVGHRDVDVLPLARCGRARAARRGSRTRPSARRRRGRRSARRAGRAARPARRRDAEQRRRARGSSGRGRRGRAAGRPGRSR